MFFSLDTLRRLRSIRDDFAARMFAKSTHRRPDQIRDGLCVPKKIIEIKPMVRVAQSLCF